MTHPKLEDWGIVFLPKAAVELDLNASIEKVTDTETIMEMGVMITPALAVDGRVKSSGKVLSTEQIKGILAGV